jgi:hypothetical protein
MFDKFFNSGNQMFDYCLWTLSFFYANLMFKDWKDCSIGQSIVWQELKRFTGILKHIDCTIAYRNMFYAWKNCLTGVQGDCLKTEKEAEFSCYYDAFNKLLFIG